MWASAQYNPSFVVHSAKTAFGLTTKANQSLNTSHLICFPLLLLCSGTKIQFYPFCQLTIICRMILIYITSKDEVDMPLIKNVKQWYDLIVETDTLIHFKTQKIFCVLDVQSRFYSLKYAEDLFYGKVYNIYLTHAVLQYIFYFWISIIHFWIFVIISVLALWNTKLGLYWADAQTYLSLCYTNRQFCFVLRCSGSFICMVNSHISNIDISKYPLISKNIVGRIP